MFYGMKRAGRALKRFGVVDFATTIAPGMRDVLLTGKVKEAVTRNPKRDKSKLIYDAVVLDAPPTGRITRFLNVTAEVRGLAKVGPVRGQAESVMALLRSQQTAVHVVTILEEMPVQETVDGVAELREAGCRWARSSSTWRARRCSTPPAQKAALAGQARRRACSRPG